LFKKTNPQQSLLESQWLLPAEKRERLRGSWAQVFRDQILPLIDEEPFRPFFEANNGQPNKSIRLLVGLHLLKERFDLTDDEVVESLEFNLAWQHALGVDARAAHVCQKTLHNFRVLVIEKKLGQALFVNTTKEIAKAAGIDFARQRQDSTHVVSNMALLTRLGILVETIMVFLKELRRERPRKFAELPGEYAQRYLEHEGYFADAKREEARRRLPLVAQDLFRLIERFEDSRSVRTLESFGLLRRVFEEQCEVIEGETIGDRAGVVAEGAEAKPAGDEEEEVSSHETPAVDVAMRDPKEISSASLQSPHDPDATYGHKGKGYEVQITETCSAENPFQVVTSVEVNGAHESDQRAVTPTLGRLSESGMKPETMIADTGYGSGENIVEAAKQRTSLLAPVRQGASGNDVGDSRWKKPVEPSNAAAKPAPEAPGAKQPSTVANRKIELADFRFSPDFSEVRECPAGRVPREQRCADGIVEAVFAKADCARCPFGGICLARGRKGGDHGLKYRQAEAATAQRQREQKTPAFKEAYKIRSGIESTNSQLKGPQGASDLRVRGKPRVRLVMMFKSLALNAFRYVRHVIDEHANNTVVPAPVEG